MIRLQKVTIKNFKNVERGEISFSRSKSDSDSIVSCLGLYGPNASGKSSFIEVLAIMQRAMSGLPVPSIYSESIKHGADHSEFSFVFDLKGDTGEHQKFSYEFKMKVLNVQNNENALSELLPGMRRVVVFDEKISVSGVFDGENRTMKPVFDTSSIDEVFLPVNKQNCFVGKNSDIEGLRSIKSNAYENGKSFVFSDDALEYMQNSGASSDYLTTVINMHKYAVNDICIVDPKGILNGYGKNEIPLCSRTHDTIQLKLNDLDSITDKEFELINHDFNVTNEILSKIVPGLTVQIDNISPTITASGERGYIVRYISRRDDVQIPLRNESDGVKRLVSLLGLFVDLYSSEESFLVAVDELDACLYEELLSDLLIAISYQKSGQLVFTSHNMRPLENINNGEKKRILDKDSTYFTTTNPADKYVRLKGIKETNSLKKQYCDRLGDDTSELYSIKDKDYIKKGMISAAAILSATLIGAGIGVVKGLSKRGKDINNILRE